MEHSDRARYVTEQVALWIVNDADHFDQAHALANDPNGLARYLKAVIRTADRHRAPGHVRQELAPNDYDRIDWAEVARQLTDNG